MRLFVFHHAGGSHLMYRDLAAHFPGDWEVHTPDAPGRLMDGRVPLERMDTLVDHFLTELGTGLSGRFALFGHSMGAALGYALTRRLLDEGRTPPVWLGVSARIAPLPAADGEEPGAVRVPLPDGPSDETLRSRVAAMGGTPQGILDDPDLWARFKPTIHGDLHLTESWRPPAPVPLEVPISAFAGTDDPVVPVESLTKWSTLTRHFLGLHHFDGDHFYFQDDPGPLARRIHADIRRATALQATAAPGTSRA
ncbi:thioesterase II family protein [Streptomyces sp. TLI_105]|uniref:thioesterase II family protein n=1 Tax=Streptomyces sp. TLI_105 TaxID=1881019 RepID=UPI00089BC1B8|nr:alpha/beta fold hydrolase [Streptomyces sp. TLI_105]SEC32042.1 Surfactin synthase thioesterase subunit [Streptomyces sp. TLI_105]